ncbi:MAG: cysteine--tRNA ligase [Candidatus Pacearchaeota archaeon]|nr:cysteine--tRNA ligase [Candidatus Pacearchaeota archaeon]
MIKVYNTLTRKKEEFRPIKGKEIKMFVCGPTVYDYSHLGHAKTYVQFDVIARYFRFKGYKLSYLQNITDIDDKIINRSNDEKTDWKKIAAKYEKEFIEDMKTLNIHSVNKYARATDYINEIISQVKRLIKKGYAYKISDGWYFDLEKYKDYGKLSGRRKLKKDDSVSRIDENKEKKSFGDFCLWKFSKPSEPVWESKELSDGRPGWHIEDTAITEKEFGVQYDLHGGGIDLMFPHHEAEIAQMESISGKKPMVKYWLHTGFLKINKNKMSKSLGNFKTIKDILKIYSPEVIRYFIISNHYRKPLDFSQDALENAKNSYNRLKNLCGELKPEGKINENYIKKFEEEMDDNFNTPRALQILWKLLRDEKARGKLKTIEKMDEIFGLNLLKKEKIIIPVNILTLAKERENFRKNKEWKKADEIRNKINKLGYILEDTEKGVNVKKG